MCEKAKQRFLFVLGDFYKDCTICKAIENRAFFKGISDTISLTQFFKQVEARVMLSKLDSSITLFWLLLISFLHKQLIFIMNLVEQRVFCWFQYCKQKYLFGYQQTVQFLKLLLTTILAHLSSQYFQSFYSTESSRWCLLFIL